MILQYDVISSFETTVKFDLFPNFTIHYKKANPLGSEHFNQIRSKKKEYYSMVRSIYVKNTTTGVAYHILTYDERLYNYMQYVNQEDSDGTREISDYIFSYYEKIKKSNPERYGTYNGHRCEGSECLYLHDIFDYMLKNQRINKLKTILND